LSSAAHQLEILSPWEEFAIAPAAPAADWNGRDWRILNDLAFRLDGHLYVIPAGFVTDGKSIPFWYRWRFRQLGEGLRAAIIHDWIYRAASVQIPRQVADWCFLEGQKIDRASHYESWLQYVAVRTGGWASYQKRQAA